MFEEVIKIRNKAGILEVHVESELSLNDVMRGYGDDKLPEMKKPRLEFHEREYGERLVTLCDGDDAAPAVMYLFILEDDVPIRALKGVYFDEESPDRAFVTVGT